MLHKYGYKVMDKGQKDWIDNASYESLLRRWRTSPSGDTIFQGEIGKYYAKVMARKKEEIGIVKAVQASKNIGWK